MWSWILFFFFLFVVMFVYFHWVDSKGGSRILNIARWITRSGRHYQQVGTGFCTGTGLDEMAPTHIFFIPFFHTFFSSFSAGLSFWRWGRLALPHFVCLDKKNRRRRNRLPLGLLPLRWKRERERKKMGETGCRSAIFFPALNAALNAIRSVLLCVSLFSYLFYLSLVHDRRLLRQELHRRSLISEISHRYQQV